MINPNRAKDAAGATVGPDTASKRPHKRQSAEVKLAELKRQLLEINDLSAAGAVLGWDQATYMPKGGAGARARQGAILSRLAHEKSVDPKLGKLLDELEPHAASLPYDSSEASLIRIARRDFEAAGRGSTRMDRAFARTIAASPTEFRSRFKTNGAQACRSSTSALPFSRN
jgi:Zn-dependent M32 family carboxypeptidase